MPTIWRISLMLSSMDFWAFFFVCWALVCFFWVRFSAKDVSLGFCGGLAFGLAALDRLVGDFAPALFSWAEASYLLTADCISISLSCKLTVEECFSRV